MPSAPSPCRMMDAVTPSGRPPSYLAFRRALHISIVTLLYAYLKLSYDRHQLWGCFFSASHEQRCQCHECMTVAAFYDLNCSWLARLGIVYWFYPRIQLSFAPAKPEAQDMPTWSAQPFWSFVFEDSMRKGPLTRSRVVFFLSLFTFCCRPLFLQVGSGGARLCVES